MILHLDLIRWSMLKSDWFYSLQPARDGRALYSVKTRLGADCGSDHELVIAKFSLKLKKVGPTTRPFRYDPDQITYNFTVVVTNRFKELECLKSCGWRFVTLYSRQWSKSSQRKRNARKHRGWRDVVAYLELNRLECEIKWTLGNVTGNKASGGDGIPAELFKY